VSDITAKSSLQDVCFAVCTALDQVGTIAVLTGGSAATYYAPRAYQSEDADFIITFKSDPIAAAAAVRQLGYSSRGGTYKHASNPFTLEFPPGPLAIGDELITEYDTIRREDRMLHLLSRTDCTRDRLASFYFFDDRSALAAAIAVASTGKIDLRKIERCSIKEGQSYRFAEFRDSSIPSAPYPR